MWVLLLACGRVAPQVVPPAPPGFACPAGATWVHDPPGQGIARSFPDTDADGCRDDQGRPTGPHLERWPAGGVAVEGAWADGARDGVWTTWYPDGAFRSQVSWKAGRQDGPRREVGRDGRVVEIGMVADVATGLFTLAPGAPMPEWEGGRKVDGTRYRTHTD